MDTHIETETEEAAPTSRSRKIVKGATGFIVHVSVSSVVKTMIKQNVTPKSKFQNAELLVAAWSLGNLVAKHAADAAEEQVDTYGDRIAKLRAKAAELQAEIEKSKNENDPE